MSCEGEARYFAKCITLIKEEIKRALYDGDKKRYDYLLDKLDEYMLELRGAEHECRHDCE